MPAGQRRTSLRGVTAALVVTIAVVLSLGCRAESFDPERRDVVLIVIDTLRADHLGAYGYGRDTSPNIDALAARGARFESGWSAAPWTLPSVMSIMTSLYPSGHRVENDGLRLASSVPTLAESFAGSGYATGAFVSHIYVSRAYGFDRGFETFDDFDLGSPGYRFEAGMEPDAGTVTDAARSWIADQGDRPLFLFVHYFDPHWPYDAPPEFRDIFPSDYHGPLDAGYDSISRFQDVNVSLPDDYRDFLIDRYDGEIRFVDSAIGRLVEALERAGRGDRTWVVLTSDHGEEFKDHRSMGHGRNLYEEVIRVPLVVAGPDGGTPRRLTTPVSGIDLFPTILELAGVGPEPRGLAGSSLVSLMSAGDAAANSDLAGRSIVSETVRLNTYQKSVRRGHRKLIRFMGQNRSELYDLANDPLERTDLADSRPEEGRDLLKALYSEVDLFSGGWNLTWGSDGAPRRFQGQIQTSGLIRSIVPLFADEGKYVIRDGNTVSFTDARQADYSGLAFTVTPYDAEVTFYLMIDGEPEPESIRLGERRASPREMPFTLAGNPSSELAFERPPHTPGAERGYYLWRTRPAAPGQNIVLDDAIRQRLRSLGYVD